MPPPNKIALLPPDVRRRLNEEIVLRGFGDYVAVSAWLRDLGYDVGKSGIAVYASRHRAAIEAEVKPDPTLEVERAAIRSRVLEVASRMVPTDQVLAKADELLVWVYRA